jgi:hypothetical protein
MLEEEPMRVSARAVAVAIVVMALCGAAGCRKDKKDGLGKTAPAVTRPIEIPRAVMAYVGVKNPQSTVDDMLAIGKSFMPQLPFDRNGLLDLFAQKAKLPRELLATIDITGSFWLVMLDETQAGERNAGVLVFPLKSRKDFEAELGKKMDKDTSDGELVRYKPKPSTVGQEPVQLVIGDKYVLAPTSKKSLDIVQPFIKANLLPHPPQYDVAVHLLVQHLLAGPGKDVDKEINRALDKLRAQMPSQQGPIDQAKIQSATEQTLRGYADLLKTTRDLMLTADVSPQQITFSLRAEAMPDGALHKVIKRQKPADPYGYKLLPASSWLVFSTLSNPEAAAERRKTWGDAVAAVIKGADEAYRERLQQALDALGEGFFADTTLALHKGASGSGLSLSLVGRTAGAAKASAALDKLVSVVGDWIKAKMDEEPDKSKVKLEKKAFEGPKGSAGTLFELALPSLSQEKQEKLSKLFGPKLTFGWAFVGEHWMLSMGKDTEAQLKRMAEGAAGGKVGQTLADNEAFGRARGAAPSRTGMIYVSLIDLARWFEGTGVEEAETIAAALKDKKVSSAPSFDWGVNAAQTQLDVSLRLPIEHFKSFKPIMDELMKKGPSFMGGGKSKWQKVDPASQPAEQ